MSEIAFPPPLPEDFPSDSVVGITTTIPIEVLLSTGLQPIDINNLFVTDSSPGHLVEIAERAGFPRTSCSWIKGIYGAIQHYGLKHVVGVVQGDCTNTHALIEMLEFEGVDCIPFEYPYQPDCENMSRSLKSLADRLNGDMTEAEAWRRRLRSVRSLAQRIDELTWKDNKVSGLENHLWLVSTSDFAGDVERYEKDAQAFIDHVKERSSFSSNVRLGFVGVPPVLPYMYDYLESMGCRVVFNETQRQFSLPQEGDSLEEVYSRYTYPYGIFERIKDVEHEIELRNIDGVVHYVQSFCYRRMEDKILRDLLDVPVLTIECDRPGKLPGQLKTRLEAFVEMLQVRKNGRRIF